MRVFYKRWCMRVFYKRWCMRGGVFSTTPPMQCIASTKLSESERESSSGLCDYTAGRSLPRQLMGDVLVP